MAFKLNQGKTKIEDLPVTPSTALAEGALLTFTSGKLVAADSSTVNRGASSVDVVQVVRVISATKGIFRIKFSGAY